MRFKEKKHFKTKIKIMNIDLYICIILDFIHQFWSKISIEVFVCTCLLLDIALN